MKRFIFLLAGFVFFSTSVWANHSGYENDSRSNNWNYSQNQPFIFMENGIEFSVFQDGQFDFFMPDYGPKLSVGFNTSNVNFSFNSGYNYNPYVQYDSYGAIIQILNTPIFYDNYGRIHQIGNISIGYNTYGLVHRIGGLQLFYRNNAYWRQSGFINHSNRRYVWRPWHRYYAVPAAQFCLVSPHPYRQSYRSVRHTYYRPYANNSRHFAYNRQLSNYRTKSNTSRAQRYVQTPRNNRERSIRSNVQRRHKGDQKTRNSRISNSSSSTRSESRSIAEEKVRSRRDLTLRVNKTARGIDHTNRRNQISSRTDRNTNSRGISQNSRRTEQARINSRKTNEVSGRSIHRNTKMNKKESKRHSVQPKRSSNNRNAYKAERSSRSRGNSKSTRSRNQ